MKTQVLCCGGIEATLVRTRQRKSVGIYVRDGKVTVRASVTEPLVLITEFVAQKQQWIKRHLALQQKTAQAANRSFCTGEQFYVLGEPLALALSAGRPARVQADGEHLHVVCATPGLPHTVQRTLEQWYKAQALSYFSTRVAHYAALMQLKPAGVGVQRFKRRWGSCSSDGRLKFNWLLMMAPPAVMDYVVVHELCHLRHFDHSKAFWALVAQAMPNYAAARQFLNQQTYITWSEYVRD